MFFLKYNVLLLCFGTIWSNIILENSYNTSELNLQSPEYENATLGGGCFWCTEAIFERIPGVLNAESGYSGGSLPNPTYLEVKSGLSGHAEVIRITFNPKVVDYEQILNAFFYSHDPTTLNRQGIDVGHQYRSVVFYHSEEQRKVAEKVIKSFELRKIYQDPIVTQLVPLTNYYPAEEYHQDYFNTFQSNQYCTVDTADISYKIEKFFSTYGEVYKKPLEIIETPKETINTEPPLPTNIKIVKSHNSYHPWHNITYGGAAPEVVVALIEISKGSRAKYEIDKMSGLLGLDRVLHPNFPYPVNYGFIPQTLYGDGDGLDILVFSSVDIEPLTLVQARIFGMLRLTDNNEKDDKLLAVVHKDMALNHIQDIEDFPTEILKELTEYYQNYKTHENISVIVEGIENKVSAHKAIKASIQLYRDIYTFSD